MPAGGQHDGTPAKLHSQLSRTTLMIQAIFDV